MNEQTIFTAAVERPPAERAAFLDQACGADLALRERVERLVGLHGQAGAFLERPAAGAGATLDGPSSAHPGTIIGPYKLLQQIGEGGMGTVYMAEQSQPVQRKVALKVIKPGMDSHQIVARFEAERQALALMDHPNISKVFDAGTTAAGRPYFVMELVKGVPITQYCDENHLPPRARLELFAQVCQALQHAHHKGVIHRDLKPTNVLVALYDDKPVPKVIDFGVAKATGGRLTERTMFTGYGQIVGTVEYMSPEQAQLNALDSDTRGDIYSLGVLLYELLTGTTPFDKKRLHEAAFDEMLRMIREDEPPKPSTRLSTTEARASIAVNRGMEPKKLSGLLRGELDWIVMKALDKDRNRRYETAKDFAADVQRYLDDETVQACPPSVAYRLRKLARRHRGPVLAASLVLLVLVVGIIGTTWGMLRATDAEAVAVSETKQKDVALTDKEAALTAAQRSKRDADEKLFGSYLAQARAFRMSRRSGQRFESLEVLYRATELARAMGLPADNFHELRNAVIASLALPDLHLTGPWIPWPEDGFTFNFDEAFALYARTDQRGNCSVRRVADDAELHHLPGLDGRASPSFSRDGQFVGVVHFEKEGPGATGVAVQLWRLEQPTARLIRSEENARDVDFHRNGHQVALAYNDGTIGLFELPSGRPLGPRLATDTLEREVGIALHPTEPLVAVTSYFGRVVQVRDVRTGELVASLPQSGGATHAAWHPDGQTLAVGHAHPPLVLLYDRTTLQTTPQPYRTMEAAAAHLAFNHAGDRLAARGWDGTVGLFDVGTGQKLFETGAAICRFSRDDQRLAGGIQDKLGFLQVGDSREYRTLVRKALPEKGLYRAVALSPDGRLLAVGMSDGFGLWDLATGSELAFMPMDEGSFGVIDLRFEPSGALLTAGYSGLLRWPVRADPKAPDRLLVGPPQRLLPRASYIGQSLDGRVIVTGNRAVGQFQAYAGGWILHADRPNEPIRLDAGKDIGFIVVDPEGRWVVTVAFFTGLAKIWDARDGVLVKQLTEYESSYPHFSPDGRWLSANVDGGRLFAVGTWEPGPRLGFGGVFAPDSRLMAIQPTTGVVRLVDRETGRELARLEDPDFHATASPLFTPDGKLIGLSKGICVWDLRLIRQHLKKLSLDWHYPEFPSADPGSHAAKPREVQFLGDLADLADLESCYNQGNTHAQSKQWDKAVAAFRKAVDFDPSNPHLWYWLASAQLCAGQRDAYRRTCADTLERFAKTKEPDVAARVLYTCLTTPDSLEDMAQLLPLAELAASRKHHTRLLGAAFFRIGKHEAAIEPLTPGDSRAWDHLFLAMAQHSHGNGEKAREYLNIAIRQIETGEYAWTERVEIESLRREAEALLQSTTNDPEQKRK